MKIIPMCLVPFAFIGMSFMNCSNDSGDTELGLDKVLGQKTGEFTFEIFPKRPYTNFENREFQLWVPENSSDLKATLVKADSNGIGSEAFPNSEHTGNASRANWLVDETFAKAWLEFQQ